KNFQSLVDGSQAEFRTAGLRGTEPLYGSLAYDILPDNQPIAGWQIVVRDFAFDIPASTPLGLVHIGARAPVTFTVSYDRSSAVTKTVLLRVYVPLYRKSYDVVGKASL